MHAIERMNYQAACYLSQANETLERSALERLRPFYLVNPKFFKDGDMFGFLYGEDLQNGICAFGKTADEASRNFDIAWLNETIPTNGLEAL
jgi:hypothetical protein